MTTFVTPMTQLDAVNIVLKGMGEPKIASLDGAGLDALMAADLVDETSRALQTEGWHWNREYPKISPDSNGFINLPSNTLTVNTNGESAQYDYVARGLLLYDRSNSTYVFTNPVRLDLYVGLPFEQLPTSARIFVAAAAALTNQQGELGSDTLNKFLKEKAETARVMLVRDNYKATKPNAIRDNWSVLATTQRTFFNRGLFQSGGY